MNKLLQGVILTIVINSQLKDGFLKRNSTLVYGKTTSALDILTKPIPSLSKSLDSVKTLMLLLDNSSKSKNLKIVLKEKKNKKKNILQKLIGLPSKSMIMYLKMIYTITQLFQISNISKNNITSRWKLMIGYQNGKWKIGKILQSIMMNSVMKSLVITKKISLQKKQNGLYMKQNGKLNGKRNQLLNKHQQQKIHSIISKNHMVNVLKTRKVKNVTVKRMVNVKLIHSLMNITVNVKKVSPVHVISPSKNKKKTSKLRLMLSTLY